MLTRRQGLAGASAASVAGLRARSVLAQAAPTVGTPVSFAVPPGACDCHVHVFPDPGRFPFWEGRAYTPPLATADDLLTLQQALHLDRVVIVQPSVYGADNSAMLDGMRQLGPKRARGVAVIGPSTSAADLDAMHKAGVRGVRLNLDTAGVTDPAAAKRILETALKQIEGRPWHIQIYTRLSVISEMKEEFGQLPVPVVFDHFAGASGTRGVDQPGFDAILDLLRSGKAYVKVSAPYRASGEAPDYPGLTSLAWALVAANASRILWGSDWPHPGGPASATYKATDVRPPYQTDDGRTLNLLAGWFPDTATRQRILGENPARLYEFPSP